VVRRTLPETIVDFLSFSRQECDGNEVHGKAFEKFSRREWLHALKWLDDSGLALYFLQKLKDTSSSDTVPMLVLSRLTQNLTANRRRALQMANQFRSLNRRFDAAGARYVVAKGFSLVPEFCPDASLRHQSDLDYLVDEPSLTVARRVLEEAGYSLKMNSTQEFIFLTPSARIPVPDEQYEADAPFSVELHLSFWDSDFHGLSVAEPRFSLDHARVHEWEGSTFRTLPEEDVFLLQVIHAFHHILSGWVRMSWLYEIGYFLNRRATDALLWESIEGRAGGDRQLREIIVVVTQLVAQFFGAPLPSPLRLWAEELRPAVRIWVQNYARTWMFGENQVHRFSLFPTAKLVLFLHQQYVSGEEARGRLIRAHLLPSTRLSRIARSIKDQPSTILSARWRQGERVFRRLLFHGTAGLRYVWEVPRWRRLNTMAARLAAASGGDSAATDLVGAQNPESTIRL